MRPSWKSLDVWADHQKPCPKQLASKKCSGSEVKFVQGVHKKECLRLHNMRSDVKKRDVKRLRESSWDDLRLSTDPVGASAYIYIYIYIYIYVYI